MLHKTVGQKGISDGVHHRPRVISPFVDTAPSLMADFGEISDSTLLDTVGGATISTHKKSPSPRIPFTNTSISSLLVAYLIFGINSLEPSLFMALSKRASTSENGREVSNVTSLAEKVVIVLLIVG